MSTALFRLAPALRPLALVALALAVAARVSAHSADEVVMRELNRRIAAAPQDGMLVFQRAELRRAGRHWDAALADYLAVRRLAPEFTEVDLGLGMMWLDAGQPQLSVLALNRLLVRSPAHPDGLITRARALARVQRHRESARDYAAALAAIQPPRDPPPEVYLELADALLNLDEANIAPALAVLDEGMARIGEGITLQLKALELEKRRNHHAGALARLDRIIARSPRPEIWRESRAELVRLAQTPAAPVPQNEAIASFAPAAQPTTAPAAPRGEAP